MNLLKWLTFNLRYLCNPPWDTGVTPPEVVDFIRHAPPGRALDLGAGTGTNLITLSKAGWQVTGVEYALLAVLSTLRKMRKNHISASIHLHNVTSLDFLKKPFDFILDIGCFHSLDIDEKEKYRKNIFRLLEKKGIYLLYSFLLESDEPGTGITEKDIDLFTEKLTLLSKQAVSERGFKKAVWLKFKNKL